jgi:response regulator of citrate/malate metabolism
MERNWFKIERRAMKEVGDTYIELENAPASQQSHVDRLHSIDEIAAKRSGYPKGLLKKTDEVIKKFF